MTEGKSEPPPTDSDNGNTSVTLQPREMLTTALAVVRSERRLEEFMPAQMFEVFLLIAMRPGRTTKELSDLTGLAQASIARNTQALGRMHRAKRPGLNVIEAIDDPTEPRRKVYFLNKQGRLAINEMLQAMQSVKVQVDPFDAPTADEHIDNFLGKRGR